MRGKDCVHHLTTNRAFVFAHQLPLPQLAALLAQSTFIGHDSGIFSSRGRRGARSIILFGPTDPNVWAPQNKDVTY
jgi:ADP-heptose:LPS heptosyltransferase